MNETIKIKKTNDDVLITSKLPTNFNKAGLATFAQPIFLYRGTTASELYQVIMNNSKMRGSIFTPNIERRFGASYAFQKTDAIKAVKANRKIYHSGMEVPQDFTVIKNKWIKKGDKIIVTINAIDKQFFHLNLQEYIPNDEGIYYINGNIGNLGLGFSIRNVTKKNIIKIELLNEEDKLVDITNNVINVLNKYHDSVVANEIHHNKLPTQENLNKLSKEGLEKFISALFLQPCGLDDLKEYHIKKIGESTFDKLISNYLSVFYLRSCTLDSNFVLSFFNEEQIVNYVNSMNAHGYSVSSKLEEIYYKNADKYGL